MIIWCKTLPNIIFKKILLPIDHKIKSFNITFICILAIKFQIRCFKLIPASVINIVIFLWFFYLQRWDYRFYYNFWQQHAVHGIAFTHTHPPPHHHPLKMQQTFVPSTKKALQKAGPKSGTKKRRPKKVWKKSS